MKVGDRFVVELAQSPGKFYQATCTGFTLPRGRRLEELDLATAPQNTILRAEVEFHADRERHLLLGRDMVFENTETGRAAYLARKTAYEVELEGDAKPRSQD